MKKIFFYILIICSVLTNVLYFLRCKEQKRQKDEFFSLFKVENITYENGFSDFQQKLNQLNNTKKFHLIHIWDTLGLEFNTKIPYILQLNGHFKEKNREIDCILMSSMSDATIKTCINSRKFNLENLIIINDMGNYISGVCNKKNRKSKPSAAILLINNKGEVIYFNDKLQHDIDNDTILLNKLDSIN